MAVVLTTLTMTWQLFAYVAGPAWTKGHVGGEQNCNMAPSDPWRRTWPSRACAGLDRGAAALTRPGMPGGEPPRPSQGHRGAQRNMANKRVALELKDRDEAAVNGDDSG